MPDEKRPYTKRRRAALEEETRQRITESAMHLHGTLGPSRTSIAAIAEHAGVQRSTVYRHFADDAAVFAACAAHWAALNPLPDLEAWGAVGDPAERLRRALPELLGFYRVTRQMLENLYRDEPIVPAVRQEFAPFRGYLAAAQDTLMAGRRLRGRAATRTRAAIGHALAFATWRSLAVEQGLDDDQAADLLCRLVEAAG